MLSTEQIAAVTQDTYEVWFESPLCSWMIDSRFVLLADAGARADVIDKIHKDNVIVVQVSRKVVEVSEKAVN